MWGSSFTDFAKAAQSLQEQAAAAADVASSGTSSLFNLDTMQVEEEEQSKTTTLKKVVEEPKEEPVAPITNSSFSMSQLASSMSTSTATPVMVAPPRVANGTLKVPSTTTPTTTKSSVVVKPSTGNEKSSSIALNSSTSGGAVAKPAKPELPTPGTDDGDDDDVGGVDDDADGWDDNENDLDFDDDFDADAGDDKNQPPASEPVAVAEKTAVPEPLPVVAKENADAEERDISTQQVPPAPEKPTTTDSTDPVDPPGVQENNESLKTIDNSSPVVPSVETPVEINVEETKSNVATPPENGADSNEGGSPDKANETENIEQSSEMEETKDAAQGPDAAEQVASAPVDADSGDATNSKKALILCSMNSMNKKAHKRQERVFTVLQGRKVPYESIDGADPQHKSWRDELFELSGEKGDYPQIFLLDMADGTTSYWGPSDRLEYANDNGTLYDELTGKEQLDWEPVPESPQRPPNTPMAQRTAAPADVDSSAIQEQFTQQLKRIEDNHAAEMLNMAETHRQEMEQISKQLSEHAIAEQQAMQESFNAKMEERDEQFHELLRKNEGMKLKMDVLKREVTGTQQLLEARDSDLGEANQSFGVAMKELEKNLAESERKSLEYRQQADEAKRNVGVVESDLEASREELAALKERVKGVAGELKERRGECRELRAQKEDMEKVQQSLNDTIESLESKVSLQNRSGSDQQEEMEQLRSKVVDAETALAKAVERAEEIKIKGENQLADYKRKAQHSLSMANARTASAVQAKEEAELEARAARSTADSSMDKAVKAEISSKEALAEAKAYVSNMESEKAKAVDELEAAKEKLAAESRMLAQAKSELSEMVAARDASAAEQTQVQSLLTCEQDRTKQLEANVLTLRGKLDEAKEESRLLREELDHLEKRLDGDNATSDDAVVDHATAQEKRLEQEANDETIRILQDDLKHANSAIESLKEALKNAVEMKSSETSVTTEMSSDPADSPVAENEATPLYFAMEKQAELRTARNEINRLVNLLADVQSDKMEAVESMVEMRRKADEAESKLLRYEKLRPRQSTSGEPTDSPEQDSGSTNIEYLKNIMLRFLNAKTLSERKSLVPVIGAVLCLTQEEQQVAMGNLSESSSLGNVGQTFFESFMTK